MNKYLAVFFAICVANQQYGQIIADHTVVDKFDDIPQYYIDLIKKMWVVVPGESHASGYMNGLNLLEQANSAFQVNVRTGGTPETYTESYLRASSATWGDYGRSSGWIYGYGEEDWFTNPVAISRTKAGITYANTNGYEISAMGFGWCWDHVNYEASSTADPVYGCRWHGTSINGPEGARPWGLDAGDYSITGNTVCLDTYLSATQEYIDYCISKGYLTKVFFTTAPVDGGSCIGESGYQGYLKQERIRAYVKSDASRILFDYADILCYDNDNNLTTTTWNGHTFPYIAVENSTPEDIGHISSVGAVRLGKAMWWMLARISGWDGVTTAIAEHTVTTDNLFRVAIVSGALRIEVLDTGLIGKIWLHSINGTLIKAVQLTDDTCVVNTGSLVPGAYIITLQTDRISQSKKIVIS